ncbi:purine-nucleoside phosphorylase [Allorhodopirellula heiligendammensis]|uniref:Purine nucleoside phosphorylase n=1 Tax=Allorhodopirellula heiligendammensis TaxID=2714739 RepID=A0A5C6C492_9BACT|nr:purine-nucleoside phosphorylase [Allorhodopirellula heiligendammensis]TWU19410.1 Purine nucleoside phosphorylase 1 [Allorhodopirellula heiligendammensis]
MLHLHDKIQESCAYIRQHSSLPPRAGIILGTGLGGLVGDIDVEATLDYADIPNFLSSTATGHAGRLVIGTLGGVPIMAMEGRFHFYEGYSLQDITLPVRVFRELGAELLIVSNACGGLNPYYQNGDIMVIEDQINLMGGNPLIGINDDRLGPRFPDMCEPYDQEWIKRTMNVAHREGLFPHKGVFVAVAGPCLETRAEYRFLRNAGADVVGMSTVPETIVAIHCGLKVVGLSVITDMCLPDAIQPANVAEIIATANAAEPRLRAIVRGVVGELSSSEAPEL